MGFELIHLFLLLRSSAFKLLLELNRIEWSDRLLWLRELLLKLLLVLLSNSARRSVLGVNLLKPVESLFNG